VRNVQKRGLETASNRSPKPVAPLELLQAVGGLVRDTYKLNQNKDLFVSIHLAETCFERLK